MKKNVSIFLENKMGYYCIIEKAKEKCCTYFSSDNEAKDWISELGKRLNYNFTDTILIDIRYVLDNDTSITFVKNSPVSYEIPIARHNIIDELCPRDIKREKSWYGSNSPSK
jgi:hypothetical protein